MWTTSPRSTRCRRRKLPPTDGGRASSGSGADRRPDAAWVRPALIVLLAVTAALYLWDLGASGWANSYYSAAVQAGTKSWKAFFFGSTDAVELRHGRQDAGVALGHGDLGAHLRCELVERPRTAGAGGRRRGRDLVRDGQAVVLADGGTDRGRGVRVDPGRGAHVPVQQSRRAARAPARRRRVHDDPSPRRRPHALARRHRRAGRIRLPRQGAAGVPGAARVRDRVPARRPAEAFRAPHRPMSCCSVSPRSSAGGWWVAIVAVWPASSRPYIGGSQNNSFWNVLFGYNGFGRLTGNESGSVGGGGQGGAGNWGPTGITRMFNSAFGGQISWLLPAALLLLVGGSRVHRDARRVPIARAPRSRCGADGWCSPASRSRSARASSTSTTRWRSRPRSVPLVGIGATTFWARRDNPLVRVLLGFVVAVTALWAYVLVEPHAHVAPDAAQRRARRRPRARGRDRDRARVCADGSVWRSRSWRSRSVPRRPPRTRCRPSSNRTPAPSRPPDPRTPPVVGGGFGGRRVARFAGGTRPAVAPGGRRRTSRCRRHVPGGDFPGGGNFPGRGRAPVPVGWVASAVC